MGAGLERVDHDGLPFVGRRTELVQLGAARDATADGVATFVTVSGDPGVGKTRLVDEVVRRGDVVAFRSSCDAEGDPPYWPLTELFREIRDHVGHDHFDALLGSSDPLKRLLDPDGVPWPESSVTANDLDRFRLFDRVVTTLTAVTQVAPIVLVIDDLQWADMSTLRLLRFLAQSLTNVPLAVYLTVRSGEGLGDERRDALDALALETTSIRLNRFNRATTAELLEHAWGGEATDGSIEAGFAATGGNAFLVVEYARLASAGASELWERYGPRLESIALGGFSRLPASDQQVLRTASVIGRRFDLDLLLRLDDLPGAEVVSALDRAVASGVIEPLGDNRFCFPHGLTRQAVYDTVPAADRAARHGLVAELLEQQHHAAPGDDARIAHHWTQVGDDDSRRRAMVHLLRAADAADERFARDDAIRGYREALDLMEQLGEAGVEEVDVRLRLANALHDLAQPDEARAVLRVAAKRTIELGDDVRFAKVALAFPPGFEGVAIVPTTDAEQVDLLTGALDRLPQQDSALRALLLVRLAVSLYWTRHAAGEADRFATSMQRQNELSGQALAMARRLDDPATLAMCVLGRLHAVWGPDHLDERPALTAELTDLAKDLGDLDLLASALSWSVLEALDAGDLSTAERQVAAYDAIATRLGQPLYRRTARQWRASIAVLRGDIDEGVDATFAAIGETAGLIGDSYALADAILLQSVQLFLRGDLSAIVEPAREVVRSDPRISINWQIGLLFSLTELGRFDEARPMFDELTADGLRRIPRDINWLVGTQLLGLSAASLGDRAVGRMIYEALLPYEGRDTTHGWGYASYGPVGWVLGVLATLDDRRRDAIEHYRAVVAARPPGPYRMVVELRLAELEVDDPACRDEAVEALHRVAEQARSWGIDRFADEAERTILRVGATRPPRESASHIVRTDRGWLIADPDLGRHEVGSSRGIDYLMDLVRHAGSEIHALDLVSRAGPVSGAGRPRLTLDDDLDATYRDLGEVIDEAARQSYRRRVRQLREEMDRMEAMGRPERVDVLRAEIESIEREIRSAIGLGGRTRRVAPEVERARVSVTKAIRRALERLEEDAGELARHLRSSVTTGTFCTYVDVDGGRTWSFSDTTHDPAR